MEKEQVPTRYRRCRLLLVILVLGAFSVLYAPAEVRSEPRQILIIRHAEKPPEEAKSVDLNAEGKQRAAALPELFEKSEKVPDPLPKPDFVFATKNTKHSHRPVETVIPLAKRLNQPIDSRFADEEYAKLADELLQNRKYAGKKVLICWHHGMIPQLTAKLRVTGAPEHWKGSVFDRVWRIDYDGQGKAAFSDLPEKLLPGDSKK